MVHLFMLLNSINIHKLKSAFPPAFYKRGHNYYLQGRVNNIKLTHKSNKAEVISATVNGSKSYQVVVEILGPINKIHIRGVCSCPIMMNCKHVVATLLEVITRSPGDDDSSQIIPFPTIKQDPRVDHWLHELNRSLTPEEAYINSVDETYGLFYLISTPSHRRLAGLEVKLSLVRRLKSGILGAPKTFSQTASSHRKHLYPIDNELLVKLEVAHKLSNNTSYFNHHMINGDTGEKILPELIATGRCHWASLKNPPLTLAPSRVAELHWQMDENGFQELRCCVEDRALSIFSIDHIWYLDEDKWVLGLLETGLDKRIAKLLLAAPKIPPEQAKGVTDLLIKHEKTAHIHRPKIFAKTKVERPKPIPCLHLFQAPIQVSGDHNQRQIMQHSKPMAQLTFDYQGIRIPWEDKRDIINHIENDQLTRIIRDRKKEAIAIDQLIIYDLVLISIIPELANLNSKFSHYFLIDYENCDPLDFSTHALPKLRDDGWRIEIANDYPYQIVRDPIDEWYSSIDEGSGYDWFGLELGITLKGEKINLLPVLQKLIQKLQANNQMDSTGSEPILAKLPDGRYIQLPTDRVRNILNVLIELYDSESLTDENMLRLSSLHAARLLELEKACGAAQLRWFGGEKTRKLASKLAQFNGIKTVKVPKEFKGELRPYQLDGLSWLQFLREYEFGGILADDMGLGKTVQALSHITLEKISGRMKNPSLVVAPTSLMFNWRMEAERFSPHLKLLVLHGIERKHRFDHISQYDLILTTYPLLVRDKEILLKQEFYLLILDEAQFIKNSKSLAAQIALQIKTTHRLCLTGTPMENHLGELWSLFHFMMPGLLGEEKKFNHLFRTPIEKHGNEERRGHLNRRITPFLLRRTKDKVAKELPGKVEMIRHVELDGAQRDLYETIRVTMQKKVRKEIAKLGLARSHIIILDALLKLRQVCCDPRLLKITTTEKKNSKSAKLELLMTLIPELLEEGRSILLFSQFTEMLGLIEEELNKKKLAYVKLTGQTKDRATPVQQFQNGKIPLFLISLKAGGTGLNLTAADTVIHYDPWWNPAVENQATDRAHRIGQNKTVFVYKFVVKGTVEEKILEMQQHKHALMKGLFSGETTGKLKLTEKDLQGLFDPLEAML